MQRWEASRHMRAHPSPRAWPSLLLSRACSFACPASVESGLLPMWAEGVPGRGDPGPAAASQPASLWGLSSHGNATAGGDQAQSWQWGVGGSASPCAKRRKRNVMISSTGPQAEGRAALSGSRALRLGGWPCQEEKPSFVLCPFPFLGT